MRTKTVINEQGEPQRSSIEIELKGTGGELGIRAVKMLITMTEQLKATKTPEEVAQTWHMLCGYAICCELCGFLTEKSAEDFMCATEGMAVMEYDRTKRQQKEGSI